MDKNRTTGELTKELYDLLKNLARAKMKKEFPGATLQPTALVHEAFMRLGESGGWKSKSYFLAAAANAMRRILVERARARNAVKRGGEYRKIMISDLDGIVVDVSDRELIELEEALHSLKEIDARKATIVEMKFFGGLTIPEMAEALGVSEATIKREWTFARALIREYAETGKFC